MPNDDDPPRESTGLDQPVSDPGQNDDDCSSVRETIEVQALVARRSTLAVGTLR